MRELEASLGIVSQHLLQGADQPKDDEKGR